MLSEGGHDDDRGEPGPGAGSDGSDLLRHAHQLVPRVTTRVHDGVRHPYAVASTPYWEVSKVAQPQARGNVDRWAAFTKRQAAHTPADVARERPLYSSRTTV